MKSEKEIQRNSGIQYWTKEYHAVFNAGKFKDVPIHTFHGRIMITYLRNITTSKQVFNLNRYAQNAIIRKLKQYEGVDWYQSTPTKKPYKEFNYHKKMFKWIDSPEH